MQNREETRLVRDFEDRMFFFISWSEEERGKGS